MALSALMTRSPGFCSFDAGGVARWRSFFASGRSVLPETIARDPCTFGQRRQLEPGDLRIAARPPDKGAEAAVGAADHVLLADDVGEAFETLRHEARVLDMIGQGVDDAGNEADAVRNLDAFPNLPFVLVTRIGGFRVDEPGLRLQHRRDDVL